MPIKHNYVVILLVGIGDIPHYSEFFSTIQVMEFTLDHTGTSDTGHQGSSSMQISFSHIDLRHKITEHGPLILAMFHVLC